MAWTYRAAGTVATGANPSPALPTGWQDNDLLVIIATSNTTYSATPPTGYTQAARQTATPNLTVWYKFAVSGETAPSITNASTTSAAVIVAYYDINSLDAVSTVATASSTTITTNTTSTTKVDGLVMSIYGGGVTSSATRAWTSPGSVNTRVSQSRTTALTGMLVCDENQAATGTTTARTATTAQTATLAAYTVAFKSGTQFTQAVTATAVATNSTELLRLNKNVVATAVATTATIVRYITKTITATAVSTTTTLSKRLATTLTATAVSTTATISRKLNKTIVATAVATTATITLLKSISQQLFATVTTVATIDALKSYFRTLSAATTITATLVISRVQYRTLAAVVITSSFISRTINKLVNASIMPLATLIVRGWFVIIDAQTAAWQAVSGIPAAVWTGINDAQSAAWQAVTNLYNNMWSNVDDSQDSDWTDINKY